MRFQQKVYNSCLNLKFRVLILLPVMIPAFGKNRVGFKREPGENPGLSP